MNKKLSDIDKKLTFQVPDGYFEDLPLKIQKRIEEEEPRGSFIKLPVWSLAMAASIVLIISFALLFSEENSNNVESLLAEISEDDLVAYVEELDLNEYDLVATFPETTDEFEFEDIEIMDELDLEDHSIDDILLEYNIELDDIVI